MTLLPCLGAIGLVATLLQSPKGTALFPAKSVVLPPIPTVVVRMPAGFAWDKHEVQLVKCYDLEYDHWIFVCFATNGVPIFVADQSGSEYYRLRAIPKSILP